MTTVVCCASGPSLTEGQAELVRQARLAGKCRLIVVNRMWERFPDADVLYAADAKWWREYWPRVEAGFNGECWACDQEIARRFGLCWIKVDAGCGLSNDPARIFSGANGGYQLIGLAHRFGATRILLVGYDMGFDEKTGAKHSHGDYPAGWSNADGIGGWIKNFGPLADGLRAAGIECVNCTINTNLPQFRRGDLATELERACVPA